MIRVDKITQDEFSENEELYNICSDIYLDKFFSEFEFSLDGISNLVFFIYYLNDEIIGFGTYQENSSFILIDSLFKDEYVYGDHHKDLVKMIMDEVKLIDADKNICLYQSEQSDCDFYLSFGFTLYKDFSIQSPDMFEEDSGRDYTRFVLELN